MLRRHSRTALVTAVVGAMLVFAAQASAGYVELSEFANKGSGPGGSGSGSGQLSNPGQADVRNLTGQLYVADTGNNRIEFFVPEGTGGAYAGELAVPSPTGVAVDQTNGSFYVAGPSGIAKFDESLQPVVGWTDPGVTGRLAVDPTSGDLLVADTDANLIRRFEPDGTAAGTFAADRPVDLAVTAAGDVIVVTSTGPMPGDCAATSAVERFSPAGVAEGTIGSLTAPGAVDVDPDDGTMAVASFVNEYFCNGTHQPQVDFFTAAGTLSETKVLPGNAQYASVPGLALAGDGSDRAYAVTKSPGNDTFGNTKIVAFELKEDPPTVGSTWVDSVSSTSAQLRAEVNPEGFATKYHFEYGTADCAVSSCASYPVPEGELNASVGLKLAGVNLTGLVSDRTYHFRIVATNTYGTSAGPDRTFHTQAAVAGPPLPEGRAWELVSPADKGDYDITYGTGFVGSYTISSDDGNSVGYNSFGAFANPKGSPIVNQYMADRSPTGWSSRALSALQVPNSFNFQRFFTLSDDLSAGIAANKFGDGEEFGGGGLYLTSLADGSVQQITPAWAGATAFVTGTRSFSRIVFEGGHQLLPPATAGFAVYEYDPGAGLSMLSYLPNGEAATEARIGNGSGGSGYEINSRAVSADASRVYFRAVDPAISEVPNVYLREGGITTRVSAAQRTIPDPDPVVYAAQFEGASEDGSVVYFSSGSKLTNDSVADGGLSSADLYRYEVTSGELTDITTADPSGGGIDGFSTRVWAVSPDGTLVYFTSRAALAPGAGSGFSTKFYVYDSADESTTLIATASLTSQFGKPWFTQPMLSKSGRQIAFITDSKLTSFENAGAGELYRYDQVSGSLDCVSCNPTGAVPTGSAEGTPPIFGPYTQREGRQSRIISRDGSVLAFTSPDPLVLADKNQVNDVYIWRGGQLHLVSSGVGRANSNMMDMSPDGHDVFFSTRDRLVGIDRDNAYDLYDARVGGGIAAQNPAEVTPCVGSDCQGPQAPPPPPLGIVTNGPGLAPCRTDLGKAKRLQKQAKAVRSRARKASGAKVRKLRKRAAKIERQSMTARTCKGGSR